VSRVGATGLWQFMYHTGKQYDLEINSYVDERSEPIKSSQASKKRNPSQEEVDAILDKISKSGYDRLSSEEKDILFKASQE
jgi:hypothetical protein